MNLEYSFLNASLDYKINVFKRKQINVSYPSKHNIITLFRGDTGSKFNSIYVIVLKSIIAIVCHEKEPSSIK